MLWTPTCLCFKKIKEISLIPIFWKQQCTWLYPKMVVQWERLRLDPVCLSDILYGSSPIARPSAMSGIWPGWCPEYGQWKLAISRTSKNDVREMASFYCPYSGHQFYEKLDVRNMESFYWSYPRHRPDHIPDIAEGRAMGLDPLF